MIKYAIWGAGVRGKALASSLGNERVYCFIDVDAPHILCCMGIQVLTKEQYMDEGELYPVIVSPKNGQTEIYKWLISNDVPYFSYEEVIPCEAFLYQFPKHTILSKCKQAEVYIWGISLLGCEVVNYLLENGVKICRLVTGSERNIDWIYKNGIERTNSIPTHSTILLFAKPEPDLPFDNNKYEIVKCYEISTKRNYWHNDALKRFHNIHKGQRCFIVATGPSLLKEDLNTLENNKEISMGVNSIFKAFSVTNWRPTYYLVGDYSAVQKEYDNIVNSTIPALFIADIAWRFSDNEINDRMYKWHIDRTQNRGKLPLFSDDFSDKSYTGFTIVYDGALQLAAYMGFKEIYLLGVDCNYTNGNDYFYKCADEKMDHNEREMILAYEAAKQYADAHGIKIYNATRGGMLEVFERVDFDGLFKE